jgi:hypothetical protein
MAFASSPALTAGIELLLGVVGFTLATWLAAPTGLPATMLRLAWWPGSQAARQPGSQSEHARARRQPMATTVPSQPPAAETAPDDPWARADTATWDPTFTVFGQAQIEVWTCALVKGAGKVPYDPALHGDNCYTAVQLAVLPVVPGRETTERDLIAESREWTQIVNPSIKALGLNAKQLHGQYVEAQLVPSGRKFTNAAGETRDATTFKFLRVFADDQACYVAAQTRRTPSTSSATVGLANGAALTPLTPDRPLLEDTPGDPHGATAASAVEAQTAAKFLAPIVAASKGDVDRLATLIEQNGLLKRVYGGVEHPDVVAAFAAAATAGDTPK